MESIIVALITGGLQLVYGAAGNYVFTIAYPID